MKSDLEESFPDQRTFPRIEVQCPVLYLPDAAHRWEVGMLVNMSAVGLLMSCRERLPEYSRLAFRLEPGSNKVVPRLSGDATIVRCNETDVGRFLLACKVLRIDRPR